MKEKMKSYFRKQLRIEKKRRRKGKESRRRFRIRMTTR